MRSESDARCATGEWVFEHGVAWVTGSAELVAAVRTAKQFLTYVASGPFQ
jgi:hypothetical protein